MFYNKDKIKSELTTNDIFALLDEFGGEPELQNNCIISRTICHNPAKQGKKKLYYYFNSQMFHCYTGCEEPNFDVFDLIIKIFDIQNNVELTLYEAMKYIALKFNFSSEIDTDLTDIGFSLEDKKYFDRVESINELTPNSHQITLQEYDNVILSRFNYIVKLTPWLDEGITQDVLNKAQIGYYPGNDQITIPHFDANDRFIGLRGRSLCEPDIEMYGKYRPIKINNVLYNHPLGMNLYGYNWNKENIRKLGIAIIVESEKSVLKYASMFGWENNITVACCGSSISAYQMELLLQLDVKEIVIAFDRQFQKIGDIEWQHLTRNLKKISLNYGNQVIISCIHDNKKITEYKNSPLDEGPDKFLTLFQQRKIFEEGELL